jgi:hypothetical protein
VPKTAIDAAKAVLRDGTPEEIEAVKSGKAKLRPTADKGRKRKKADPPAPQRQKAYAEILAYEAARSDVRITCFSVSPSLALSAQSDRSIPISY